MENYKEIALQQIVEVVQSELEATCDNSEEATEQDLRTYDRIVEILKEYQLLEGFRD